MSYAAKTKVPVEQSRMEIERVLRRAGADELLVAWSAEHGAAVTMRIKGLQARLALPPPNKNKFRTSASYEQEERRWWRALILMTKAKLEAIESGVSTLEQEFLAYIVLPNGQTLSEHLAPMLPEINRKMPPLLPGAGEHDPNR